MVLGLISAPLMTSHLGVVDFGRWVTVAALVTIANTLTEAGLGNLALRDYAARSGPERRTLMATIFGLKLVLAVAAVAGAVAFALAAGYDRTLVLGTALVGLGTVLSNIQGVYGVPLAAELRLGWLAVIDVVRQVVFVAAVVVLVLTGAGLLPFFMVFVLAAAAALTLTLFVAWRLLPIGPRFDLAAWKGVLRETVPFAVATAVGVLYFRVAVVAMGFVSSEQQTGYFSASFRLIEVLAGVPYLLASTAFPILARAARDSEDRLRYALQRLFEVGLLLGTGAAVALFVGADFAIAVITGGTEEFRPAVPVLRIQSVALLATFLIGTWSFALLSLSEYRALLRANLGAFVLVLALTMVLASRMGAEGTAVAMTVTEFYLAVALAIGLVRARPSLRMRLGIVWKVAVAAAVALAAGLLPGLPSLPAALLAGAVYAAVVLALRAVPPELGRALLRRS
jgi:O-antigen/teichoic acid export membrane protein